MSQFRMMTSVMLFLNVGAAQASDKIGLSRLPGQNFWFSSSSSCAQSSSPELSPTDSNVTEAGALGGTSGAEQLLLDTRNGLQSAWQLCNSAPGTCDQTLVSALLQLQGLANALEQAIPQGRDAIDYAVQQLEPVLSNVCLALGGDSCVTLGGASNEVELDPNSADVAGPVDDCETRCERLLGTCEQGAYRTQTTCVAQWDQFIGCWQRVPYPEGQTFPPWIRDDFNRSCLQFVQAGRLPPSRCGCPQEERRGGCPQFFETGQLCDNCTFMPCEDSPTPICSCTKVGATPATWNFTQCDSCRWFNNGDSLGKISKGKFCSINWDRVLAQCDRTYLGCVRGCSHSP
jgi:hypothetical protein